MIQLAQVQRELAEIVAERPAHVYVKQVDHLCRNVRYEDGQWVGDCLIGCWFVRFRGVSAAALSNEGCIRLGATGVLAHCYRYHLMTDEISLRAVSYLVAVQNRQDEGMRWHRCLALSDDEAVRWADTELYSDSTALRFQSA